jgi:hypothetical protein
LAEIHPVEISFSHLAGDDMRITWIAGEAGSLLHYNRQATGLLPSDTYAVYYAKFTYRLSNRDKWELITVRTGQSLCYERDGGCGVIEEWLRRRGFVKNPIDRNL